jgi:hypothetical protein
MGKVGETPMVKVPPKKGVNISIIGCISPFGIINFSKVEPLQQKDASQIEKEFPQPESKKKKTKCGNSIHTT